jgi:hypothetical protein
MGAVAHIHKYIHIYMCVCVRACVYTHTQSDQNVSVYLMITIHKVYINVVCLKRSVNGTRKQTKQKIQTINFIGLHNNRHPSQHTVSNVQKAVRNM